MPYRETWIERANSPKHYGPILSDAVVSGTGYNPTCGDTVKVYLDQRGGRIRGSFEGTCCAVCKASADALCDEVEGLSIPDAKAVVEAFRGVLTQTGSRDDLLRTDLAYELCYVAEVLPARVRCAELAWKVADNLLGGMQEAE